MQKSTTAHQLRRILRDLFRLVPYYYLNDITTRAVHPFIQTYDTLPLSTRVSWRRPNSGDMIVSPAHRAAVRKLWRICCTSYTLTCSQTIRRITEVEVRRWVIALGTSSSPSESKTSSKGKRSKNQSHPYKCKDNSSESINFRFDKNQILRLSQMPQPFHSRLS